MAKEKITDFIAYVGIFFGFVAGVAVVRAELYLSPMSYTDSFVGLLVYFYSCSAVISLPFFLLRICIRKKNWLRGAMFFLVLSFVLSLLFCYGHAWWQRMTLIAVWLSYPVLLVDVLFKDTLKRWLVFRGQ